MNTMTVDYFGMIPNDVLHIILSFVDCLKDSFSLLLLSKRFYHLVKPNESQWKYLCLKFWKEYKKQLTQQGSENYSVEGEYDLELAQRESGKEWLWFSQFFIKGKIFKSGHREITIGLIPEKEINGWGIQIYSESVYIGNLDDNTQHGAGIWADRFRTHIGQFSKNEFDGSGTQTLNSGIKYEGEWSESYFEGLGTITYPDGIRCEGQWSKGKPGCIGLLLYILTNGITEFDALHPMVKECIEQGLCTNTLPKIMPQTIGILLSDYYCQTCWIHCQQRLMNNSRWSMDGIECKCKDCSRRSIVRQNKN